MGSYDVQFSEGNVVQTIKQHQSLEGKLRSDLADGLDHHLNSGFTYSLNPLHEVLFPTKRARSDAAPLSIFQRAYIHNIFSTAYILTRRIDSALEHLRRDTHTALLADAHALVSTAQSLCEFLPALPNVEALGPLDDWRRHRIGEADLHLSKAVYALNLQFSPVMSTGPFNLRQEINNFLHHYWTERGTPGWFYFDLPQVCEIETKEDYFHNAVLPLFMNVGHHAFDPEHDTTHKMDTPVDASDKKFHPYCGIGSDVDEAKKEVTIRIVDNGVGIAPDLVDRLFQAGATTSTDSEHSHGLGLSLVKAFIERNGGRIWVETEAGKGTTFSFTIPYKTQHEMFYSQVDGGERITQEAKNTRQEMAI